ncbi:MAG: hemolysin family protein [Peptococcia bacterium]
MDPDSCYQLIYVVIFVLLSSFLVMCKIALRSLKKKKFQQENSVKKNPRVLLVNKIIKEHPDIFIALFLGILMSWIIVIGLGTVIAVKYWGESWGVFYSLVILVATFMVIGKIIPETLGQKYATQISCLCIKVMLLFKYLFYPLTKLFALLKHFCQNIMGIEKIVEDENEFTEEEIINMVASGLIVPGQNEGMINQVEKTMLHGVIEFADIVVKEVMTPRPDIITVDINISYEDLIKVIKEKQFSRIPVYEETVDNILGVMHIKDLILLLPNQREDFCLEKYIRQTIFVPETKKISELFMVMKKEKIHMAIVLDEYGSTAGIVTLEDLIEEIMGDIQDEHDREEPLLQRIDDDTVEINASMRVEDLNENLGLSLSCEEAETVGGLIFAILDRIPVEGDKLKVGNLELSVLEMEGHRIEKVCLRKIS